MREEPWAYDRQGRAITMDQFSKLVVDPDYKRVASDHVGPYWVSTVWLGMDHGWGQGPPLIFETMVFAADHDERTLGPDLDLHRWSTEEAALRGHAEVVTLVRATTVEEPPRPDHETTNSKEEPQ